MISRRPRINGRASLGLLKSAMCMATAI
jgi:hypothetical protein